MNRSPLFYPLNRGMDADAGGAADLQTDVMRFMAIISMCLVAIFALVQSIPVTPVAEPPPPVAETTEPAVEEAVPESPLPEPDIVLTRPAAAKIEPKQEPIVLKRPTFKPVARPVTRVTERVVQVAPAPVSEAPAEAVPAKPIAVAPSQSQDGFTLRFESDQALTRLVARDVVGLYAISSENTHRMNVDSDEYSFWSASAPERFHEMDARTVPEPVMLAYQRRNPAAGADTQWGVSIPAAMSRQLNQFLAENSGGSLIIGLDGALRLEQ